MALKKTSVSNLMQVIWKTVPSTGSGMMETALSEPSSAPRLGIGSSVRRSESSSTAGTRDGLNRISQVLCRTVKCGRDALEDTVYK